MSSHLILSGGFPLPQLVPGVLERCQGHGEAGSQASSPEPIKLQAENQSSLKPNLLFPFPAAPVFSL